MKCPHCNTPLEARQPACHSCGFSLTSLRPFFGDQWVRLDRLTDAAHCLRIADRHRADALLDDFERTFPQVFLACYFGALPPALNAQEVAFWLLNHGAFSTHLMLKRNDYGIVCVVDPTAEAIGISMGYALESLLPASAPQELIRSMAPALQQHQFLAAIHVAAAGLSALLKPLAMARPAASFFSPAPGKGSTAADFGLQPLRAGHQQADVSRTHQPASRR